MCTLPSVVTTVSLVFDMQDSPFCYPLLPVTLELQISVCCKVSLHQVTVKVTMSPEVHSLTAMRINNPMQPLCSEKLGTVQLQ